MSTFQMIVDYLVAALALGVTFLYGSVGEILIEKVGHLNLGIPGVMCMGGAGGCLCLNILRSYENNNDVSLPSVLV